MDLCIRVFWASLLSAARSWILFLETFHLWLICIFKPNEPWLLHIGKFNHFLQLLSVCSKWPPVLNLHRDIVSSCPASLLTLISLELCEMFPAGIQRQPISLFHCVARNMNVQLRWSVFSKQLVNNFYCQLYGCSWDPETNHPPKTREKRVKWWHEWLVSGWFLTLPGGKLTAVTEGRKERFPSQMDLLPWMLGHWRPQIKQKMLHLCSVAQHYSVTLWLFSITLNEDKNSMCSFII